MSPRCLRFIVCLFFLGSVMSTAPGRPQQEGSSGAPVELSGIIGTDLQCGSGSAEKGGGFGSYSSHDCDGAPRGCVANEQ